MKFFFSLVLIISITHNVWAQNEVARIKETVTSVLPVSPEAASLGKFIEAPVSNYTGIPEISIPLHQIKKGDINLNISINYHSGGVRVDEIASRVGLGWALNAGGSIIRSTRGLPDDGLLQNSLQKYLNNQMGVTERQQYLVNVANGTQDSEPDVYYLSINDINAKIFKGDNGEWVTMPRNQNIKIQENIDGYYWIITDGKGICYKFKDREFTNNASSTGEYGDNSAFSSWLLSEIEDSKGNKVNFIYESSSQSFFTKNNELVSVPDNPSTDCKTSKQFDYSMTSVLGQRLTTIKYADGEVRFISSSQQRLDLSGDKSLDKIEIFNNQSFIKRYQLFTSYFQGTLVGKNIPNIYNQEDGYHLKLDSIREESAVNYLKPYRFNYNSQYGLPYRNSNGTDHWGYFNGQDNYGTSVQYWEFNRWQGAKKRVNPNTVKDGVLAKITYPTGGTIEYEYESNVYKGSELFGDVEETEVANLSGSNSVQPNDPWEGLFFRFEKTFEMSAAEFGLGPIEMIPIPMVEGLAPNCSCSVIFTLVQPDNSVLSILSQASNPFFLSQRGTYKLIAEITMEYAGNPFVYFNLSLKAKKNRPNEPVNVNGPGLRVKSVKRTFSPENILTKYYNYIDPSTGLTSGKIANIPDYTRPVKYSDGAIPSANCSFTVYSSNSNYPLINTKGSFVGYTMVTVTEDLNGDIGKTIYKYSYADDTYISFGFPFPPNYPPDWKSGLLTEESSYKKVTNGYELLKKRALVYSVRSGSEYTTRGLKVGKHIIINNASLSAIAAGITPQVYSISTDAFLLASDTVVTRENGLEIKTIENYDYSNKNYQVSSVRNLNSMGKEKIRRIYYPSDYIQNTGGSTLLTSMINRNMVNVPVEIVNTVLDGTVEKFNSSVAYEYAYKPLAIQGGKQIYLQAIYEGNGDLANVSDRYNFLSIPSHYIERVRNVAVNDYGSPLHTKVNGKQDISYLWSYNNQYLIAEIKNVDYSALVNSLGLAKITEIGNSNPDKLTVHNFLDPLKLAFSNAEIKSYSYDPLIGMRSATDQKGQVIYYEYDAFRRLQRIKDQKGNIIKSYEYHFKP